MRSVVRGSSTSEAEAFCVAWRRALGVGAGAILESPALCLSFADRPGVAVAAATQTVTRHLSLP